jgi:hypothetical protein
MYARLFLIVLFFLSGAVQAGYSTNGSCYETIQEAVSRAAYYKNGICVSGDCRILSYVPTSSTAQVISQGVIVPLTITSCSVVDSTLPAYIQPSPWFGSDPGTVSACGSTVNTNGGVSGTGSGSSAVTELTPEQKTQNFKDGMDIGWLISGSMVAVWALMQLAKAFHV